MLRRVLPALFVSSLFAFSGLETGTGLPEFRARTSSDAIIASADLQGKVVLVEVWASYCTVCRAQFPILRQLDRDYRERGLRIIGISMDTDVSAFQRAIGDEKPSWPQICEGKGPDGELARTLKLDHTPAFYLVDRAGKIVAGDLLGEQLRSAVMQQMNGGAPAAAAQQPHVHGIESVLRLLHAEAGERIADIGAGMGSFTFLIAKAVGEAGKVYAVDIDEKNAIRTLRSKVERDHVENVEVILSKPDDPSLPAGSLDAALIVNAYHEIEPYESVLRHVHEALKPDGRLVICDNMPGRTRTQPRAVQIKNHMIAPEIVEPELRKAGFRIESRNDDIDENPAADHARWVIVARRM